MSTFGQPVPSRTVMVFGAGFTKAYLSHAPMMIDTYDADGALAEKFKRHDYASRLLSLEQGREDGKINIERLMTRLDSGMPFDDVFAPRAELENLLHDVHHSFFKKLHAASRRQPHTKALTDFAKHCVVNRINCITFNYDDVFDWALALNRYDGKAFWRLSHGYGFHLPATNVPLFPLHESATSMLLIKLHGSVNWRIRLGRKSPINLEDIRHLQDWDEHGSQWTPPVASDETSELDPFIVPPILMKSAITRDPLLKFLWIKAYKILQDAGRVVFVGYSMPDTDIASRFLFREAIPLDARIDVVVKPIDAVEGRRLKRTYTQLFARKELHVYLKDARPWLSTFVKDWVPETPT